MRQDFIGGHVVNQLEVRWRYTCLLYTSGEGTIVNMEGSGEHSRLQVAFQGQGIKWLVAAYARLETV